MSKQIVANLPREILRAAVEPSSVNADALTVSLKWYTGVYVRRYSWEHGEIELAFDMKPAAVRMGRLQNGAPLLNAHSNWNLADVIGVVETASIKGGEGFATVRFSDRDEVAPIFRDVQNGIIRNVSMGAAIYQMKEVTQKGDALKRFLAIDWEPRELSLLPIGADADAQTLAEASSEEFPCTITLSAEALADAQPEATTMKVRLLSTNEIIEIEDDQFDESLHSKDLTTTTEPAPDVPGDDKSEDRKLADFKEAEQKRSARIRELMIHFEEDEIWAQRHIKLGSSVDVAKDDGQRRAAEKAAEIDGRLDVGNDYGSLGWKHDRMTEALFARAAKGTCPEPAEKYREYSLAECAFEILEVRGETRGRRLDPLRRAEDVIKLAMATTDFPGLLANVLNKTLLPAYEAATPSYRAIAAQRDFADYRPHRFVRVGDFPETKLIGEGGEVTEGAIGESTETVTALKYGRILNLLWEVLVNDDLGAFSDFGGLVARRIVDRENALFYATCIAAAAGMGPSLADGVAVHNAAHANLTGAGALANSLLESAYALLMAQTSIDGIKLNVPPKYLLTSVTSWGLGRRLLTPTNPTQASEINTFAGIIDSLADANITGTRFYVFADPANLPNFIYGTVSGAGPRFEVRQGFEIEGVQVKAVHDFGCGAIDYRGSVSGAGA